jgi:hypothetical protein|tara:strand:- start:725 stop:916 length:192 start_codon:yes stop_codon:yes gene_type:complete
VNIDHLEAATARENTLEMLEMLEMLSLKKNIALRDKRIGELPVGDGQCRLGERTRGLGEWGCG